MVAKEKVRKVGIGVGVVVAFLIGLAVGPYVFPPAPVPVAEQMWNDIKTRGVIRVGSDPYWPPYEFIDPETGEYTGFEVKMAEMVAERLGLTIEWRYMSFEAIIPAVEAKEIDMGISGFSVYPERLEVIQYTIPHSITEGQIIMFESRRDELGITMITSLEELVPLGLTIGTQIGTTQSDELNEKAPRALRIFDDFELALEALKIGEIDGVYAETPITTWWIMEAEKKGEPPLVVIFTRPYWPVAHVVHIDNDIFVAKWNAAFATLIAEGKIAELRAKWRC